MKVKSLQDLKPYTKEELENIFELENGRFEDVLKSLSVMNIIKKVTGNLGDYDLEDLLNIDKIEDVISDSESSTYIFKYVGIVNIYNTCLMIYPKYLKNYEDDKHNNYRLLKEILEVIKKYQSKEQRFGYSSGIDIDNFNLLSITLELIDIYNNYGFNYFCRRSICYRKTAPELQGW